MVSSKRLLSRLKLQSSAHVWDTNLQINGDRAPKLPARPLSILFGLVGTSYIRRDISRQHNPPNFFYRRGIGNGLDELKATGVIPGAEDGFVPLRFCATDAVSGRRNIFGCFKDCEQSFFLGGLAREAKLIEIATLKVRFRRVSFVTHNRAVWACAADQCVTWCNRNRVL